MLKLDGLRQEAARLAGGPYLRPRVKLTWLFID